MSQIYDRLYNDPEMPSTPDTLHWRKSWEVDQEHDARLGQEQGLRSVPKPVGGASLASRIRSLFK